MKIVYIGSSEFSLRVLAAAAPRLRPDLVYELEYNLVFAYVGGQHFSSHIIEKQIDNFARGAGDAVAAMTVATTPRWENRIFSLRS